MIEQFDIAIDPNLLHPPTRLPGDSPASYNQRCMQTVQWLQEGNDQRVNADWSTPFRPEDWPELPAHPPTPSGPVQAG
jgi:hypothetical protein